MNLCKIIEELETTEIKTEEDLNYVKELNRKLALMLIASRRKQ